LHWQLSAVRRSIVEAQDELSATALNMNLGALVGNIRTQTLRAFVADEMKQIIAKMA
jgi:uncharacterized protein with GYD domain